MEEDGKWLYGLDKREYKPYHQDRFCCDYIKKLKDSGKYGKELRDLAKFNEEYVHGNYSQSLKETTAENPNTVDYYKTPKERQEIDRAKRSASNDFMSRARNKMVSFEGTYESSVLQSDYLFESTVQKVFCKTCKGLARRKRPKECLPCEIATTKANAPKKVKERKTFQDLIKPLK